jgi:isopenicillin-N N-acyltransferase-like protein
MWSKSMSTGRVFPFYRFSGTHYQIGRLYGSCCHELIRRNLDLSMLRLQRLSGASREQIILAASKYRPFLLRYAPFLDDELRGLADSTGLSMDEIYFLQLRAEIQATFTCKAGDMHDVECTSFAISASGTAGGAPLAGQNADLPSHFSEVCVLVEITTPDHPPVLMLTPAGQVSYLGMNSSGLCVFANTLVCDGWRHGFPRYCLSRLALTQDTVGKAEQLLMSVERASSRNLLMVDSRGEILDLEFAVKKHDRLTSTDGRFVHANHFLSPELLAEERASPADLTNSKQRLMRLQSLIKREFGSLDVEKLQSFLRDRDTYPDPICIEPGDPGQDDEMTVAALIADPAHRSLWAAVGPPSKNPFVCYTFSAG